MKKTMMTGILSIALLAPALALADAANPNAIQNCPTDAVCNPLKATSVEGVLNLVVDVAIPVGAIIAVLAFIIVGFKFIAARGNPDKIKEAREWFIYAAIGTAILLGARIIIAVIMNTLEASGVVNQNVFH